MIFHNHHIIPIHAGGSSDPSNLIELTVEEHAEAHRLLFEQNGSRYDEIAWQTLSGKIGKEEAIRQAQIVGGKMGLGRKLKPRTIEYRAKMSRSLTGRKLSLEHCYSVSKALKGQPNGWLGKHHKPESKEKISIKLKGRLLSLEVCSKMSMTCTGLKRGPYKSKIINSSTLN